MDGRVLAVAVLVAVAAGCFARAAVRQPARLSTRVQPYTVGHRRVLGTVRADLGADVGAGRSGVMLVFGPLVRQLADGLASVVDASNSTSTELRLRQAGLDLTVERYRTRQLAYTAASVAGGASLGLLLDRSAGVVLLLAVAAGLWGATWWRGRVDRLITKRRERMRSELYTVCQLLAVYLRTGDTPAGAVDRLIRRSLGEVIVELSEAAAEIRTGHTPALAFEHLTSTTPEPDAARLYRLLASSWSAGGDDEALFALGEDMRASRREDLGRLMAKRETAMALPLVMVIGPILILFVAAAIPHIVFGR
ncbi:MAG: type II secretion system F family protein [Acidimicrobiia bacterium]